MTRLGAERFQRRIEAGEGWAWRYGELIDTAFERLVAALMANAHAGKRDTESRADAARALNRDPPPMPSASLRDMDRPRPVPPKRREVSSRPCANSSKMRACSSSVMPMPVSATAAMNVTCSGSVHRPPPTSYGDTSGFSELDGIAREIEQNLAQAQFIDQDARRQVGRGPAGYFDAFGVCARCQELGHAFSENQGIDPVRRQGDASRIRSLRYRVSRQ